MPDRTLPQTLRSGFLVGQVQEQALKDHGIALYLEKLRLLAPAGGRGASRRRGCPFILEKGVRIYLSTLSPAADPEGGIREVTGEMKD